VTLDYDKDNFQVIDAVLIHEVPRCIVHREVLAAGNIQIPAFGTVQGDIEIPWVSK
jgi:hypothetical protein